MMTRFSVVTMLILALAAPALRAEAPAAEAPAAETPAVEASSETEKPAPKPKKKAAKPKKKTGRVGLKKPRPGPSQYKSTELSEASEHHYRYDAKGNPILPKTSKPKAKRGDEEPDAALCSDERPCTPKDPDADAL